MSDSAGTGVAPTGVATLAVMRSMITAELQSAATRLQQASSGGAHGANQV